MYKSPTLYKTSSTGAELEWRISTQASNVKGWQVISEHGQVGGVIQISAFDVLEGKNIGKTNETTPEEQADSEAKSKFNKQIDKGYSEQRGGASKERKPMLAHAYDDHKKKVTFPCYMQPKLDGMRCVAIFEGGVVTLMSRGNKEIHYMDHIKAELATLMEDGEAWDGELYSHDHTFQDIMKYVKKACQQNTLVEYHVYDIIDSGSFDERFANQFSPLDNGTSVKFVTTGICKNEPEIKAFHDDFVRMGYEGAIIRNGDCKYKEGGRSNQLLKVKAFFDAEYEIVDVVPAERSPEQGIFVCLIPNTDVRFSANPEGSHELREQYLRDKASLIGKQLTVRYFEMTTSEVPVPRFPIGVAVRDYE